MDKQILEGHIKLTCKTVLTNRKNYKRKRTIFIIVMSALIVAYPSAAYAYIDPGITGLFFQAVFAFVFGVVFVWIARPFRYFVILIKKIKTLFYANKKN